METKGKGWQVTRATKENVGYRFLSKTAGTSSVEIVCGGGGKARTKHSDFGTMICD